MNELSKQYFNVKDEVLEHLKGPLTPASLSEMLDTIRKIAEQHVDRTAQDDRETIITQAKGYIPPNDLHKNTLTADIVIKALAVSVLIDEYFMSLTNVPGLKKHLWDELEKDGKTIRVIPVWEWMDGG